MTISNSPAVGSTNPSILSNPPTDVGTPSGDSYEVQYGDTISSAAQTLNVSPEALHAANPHVLNPDVLYPGDSLNLPANEPILLAQAAPTTLNDALQSRSASATPTTVPEKFVTQFTASNAKAVTALNTQLQALDKRQVKLDAAVKDGLTGPSAERAQKIGATIKSERDAINTELSLRTDAANAISRSTQPKGSIGKDPAVASALTALSQHQKTNSLTAQELTGLDKKIDGLIRESTYDKPYYARTKYGNGPAYVPREASDTKYNVTTSPGWKDLVDTKKVTASEQRVISRMSDNEGGHMDALQAWDSETVTLGAMQKTANDQGHGELSKQVYEFSQSNPDKYKELFADKGWTVAHTGTGTTSSDYTMSFKDPSDPKAKAMTGTALRDYIHQNDPKAWDKTMTPLLQAGRDVDFQKKQIIDFKARLDEAVSIVPSKKVNKETISYPQPISAYLTSEQGAALVLDESVNRPAHVSGTFNTALDTFYKVNPTVSKDPTTWTAQQRATYEPQILADYVAARNATNMTDPDTRAAHITGANSGLSAAPGSFVRTTP